MPTAAMESKYKLACRFTVTKSQRHANFDGQGPNFSYNMLLDGLFKLKDGKKLPMLKNYLVDKSYPLMDNTFYIC
jgi:hypothetical protein